MSILLAIDTSAGTSVALFRDGVLAAELNVTDNMKHAETVGTAIVSVLTEAGVAAREVQEVVVGRGPAPFTGLRVGIAAAVMFAEGSGAKLSGLVSLDAIALTALKQRPASETRPLLVATDARRSEVYWALYSGLSDKGVAMRIEGPQVIKPAALDELAKDPDTYVQQLADPASKQPYGYTRIDGKTYRLQATFDLPTPAEDEQQPWNRDDFFKHASGEQAFTLTAPEK